jgi:hypothetical protein
VASRTYVRWVAIGMAALLIVGLVAGVASSIGGGGGDSSTTSSLPTDETAGSDDTVPRDGDPEFCAAIVAFQDAYLLVGEPAEGATPAEVEAGWNDLAAASGQMTELAPAEMAPFVTPVVSAFDTLRQDAEAVGYEYGTFDDLASAATIDPQGDIAQSAFALFTYEDERCPVDTTATTTG